jgi:hypothetical protein
MRGNGASRAGADVHVTACDLAVCADQSAEPIASFFGRVWVKELRAVPDDSRAFAAWPGSLPKIDTGTGLPTAGNTHEVAQAVAPDAPGRLRGQRPLQVGLCTRALSRVGCLKRT